MHNAPICRESREEFDAINGCRSGQAVDHRDLIELRKRHCFIVAQIAPTTPVRPSRFHLIRAYYAALLADVRVQIAALYHC
jgi:hypothetical protein